MKAIRAELTRQKWENTRKVWFKEDNFQLCRFSQTVQSLSDLPPSSLFYYSFSLRKPEFICHSITPADPITPAASGDSQRSKLRAPTAVWLAVALISATSSCHKGGGGEMKSESGSFRFTSNSWIDSDADWQDEASGGRGVTGKCFIYFFKGGLEIDGKEDSGHSRCVPNHILLLMQ